MIRRVTIKNFKGFKEHVFDLADSVVLAGPNNAGKTTLLQAIATWKFALDRWLAQREGGRAVARSGVAIPRADITAVPLREMNLLWNDRRVTGPQGMSGARRLIEIIVEGQENDSQWSCGIELQYTNRELMYARPINAKDLDSEELRDFPPEEVREVNIVHVPPLSGIERDEPRRDRGMQDLLIGQGRPGEILRNLLLEIAEDKDEDSWNSVARHIYDLFRMDLQKPSYSPAQPYIECEYKEPGNTRPLDLSNAGSGTLQVLLLLAFIYARPASVILLDEPDAHQHVILQRQVYDLVRTVARAHGGQVIVATHSRVVLDATLPERVISLFGNRPRQLTHESERDQLREALKRVSTTGILLAREVGAVLYVEGKSDQHLLSEWAKILQHPTQSFFERAFVHWLGGNSLKEARDHYFAIKAVVPELRAVCILDGDNKDKPDEETKKSGLVVLRWHRYEIENYLLLPEAIKRFVGFPLLDHEIDQTFWSQVPQGTDLFGDHVSLSRIKASDEFLVPLLESIENYTTKSELFQLAAVMKQEEIHPEISEKLDRIMELLSS